jgi:hypothetical protein
MFRNYVCVCVCLGLCPPKTTSKNPQVYVRFNFLDERNRQCEYAHYMDCGVSGFFVSRWSEN